MKNMSWILDCVLYHVLRIPLNVDSTEIYESNSKNSDCELFIVNANNNWKHSKQQNLVFVKSLKSENNFTAWNHCQNLFSSTSVERKKGIKILLVGRQIWQKMGSVATIIKTRFLLHKMRLSV